MAANRAEALEEAGKHSNKPIDFSFLERPSSRPLTIKLIQEAVGEADESELLAAKVLRLSWLGLTTLDHLDLFSNCRDLYLQHNNLTSLEGLEDLANLEFLAVGSNPLCTLEGLGRHPHLLVLDISDTQVADIAADTLPSTIKIINVANTPFAKRADHRARLMALLPECECIDGVDVDVYVDAEEEDDADAASPRTKGPSVVDADDDDVDDAPISFSVKELEKAHADLLDGGSSSPAAVVGAGSLASASARYKAREEALSLRFQEHIAQQEERLAELSTAAASSSGAELEQASKRLRGIRETLLERMVAREAALEQQVTETIAAFRSLATGTGSTESAPTSHT